MAPASVGFFVVADYGLRHSQNWISVFPRLLGSSPKISPSGYWFSPEENYIRDASVIRTLYKILLRAIGFHLEAS